MSQSSDSRPPDDPFEAHFRRDPLPGAPVRVVVLDRGGNSNAEAIGSGLVSLLDGHKRSAELRVVSIRECGGIGPAIECGQAGASTPLLLITTAVQPWTDDHLKPLLDAIDRCDHAIGRRPGNRVGRWLANLRWRLIFGVTVSDVHSPCALHRREALEAIPLQSNSSFAEVELLAKATFLRHLIDEVPVPALEAPAPGIDPADVHRVLRHPRFRRESAPAEELQGEEEGDDRPCGQDQQRSGDVA